MYVVYDRNYMYVATVCFEPLGLSTLFVSYFCICLPRVGPGRCRISLIRFLAGRNKRRPEPGFNFVRFSFTYVCSYH